MSLNKKDLCCVAEAHAKWYSENLQFIVEKVYKDAFLHGFKHGLEDKK